MLLELNRIKCQFFFQIFFSHSKVGYYTRLFLLKELFLTTYSLGFLSGRDRYRGN